MKGDTLEPNGEMAARAICECMQIKRNMSLSYFFLLSQDWFVQKAHTETHLHNMQSTSMSTTMWTLNCNRNGSVFNGLLAELRVWLSLPRVAPQRHLDKGTQAGPLAVDFDGLLTSGSVESLVTSES